MVSSSYAAWAGTESPSLPDIESETYASFLDSAAKKGPPGKVLVILGTTIRLEDFSGDDNNLATRIHEALPSATERVVTNFLANANTQADISSKSIRSKSNTPFAIMSQAKEVKLFRDRSLRKGWSNFQLRYPKSPPGYIQFSRIGYDPVVDQALVFVRFYCGPSGTCGAGYLILFQKQHGIWNEAGSYLWLIS